MDAIILHNNACRKIRDIQKKLNAENIKIKNKIWTPGKSINFNGFDVNMILIYLLPFEDELLDAISALRKQKQAIPIVVIDEVFSEKTQKKCLSLGADFYASKPIDFKKFAMDLKILVCKKEALCAERKLKAFSVLLDIENRFAKRENKVIPLRNKEFSLLEFFMINSGKILTRNMILEHVWDRNANFASNTVDVHINRLRRKLDDPFKEKLIHTVHCVGYRFSKKKFV